MKIESKEERKLTVCKYRREENNMAVMKKKKIRNINNNVMKQWLMYSKYVKAKIAKITENMKSEKQTVATKIRKYDIEERK